MQASTSSSPTDTTARPKGGSPSIAKQIEAVASVSQLADLLSPNRDAIARERFSVISSYAAATSSSSAPLPPPAAAPPSGTPAKGGVLSSIIAKTKEAAAAVGAAVTGAVVGPADAAACAAAAAEAASGDDARRAREQRSAEAVGASRLMTGLRRLAIEIVGQFGNAPVKTKAMVDDVVSLSRVEDREVVQVLLDVFVSQIDHDPLLQVYMLEGLACILSEALTEFIPADQIVKTLNVITSKLKDLHAQQQNAERIYDTLRAVNRVLRAMWATGVCAISKEDKNSTLGVFQALKDAYSDYGTLECWVASEAELAKQNLLRVADDELMLLGVAKRIGHGLMAVQSVATMVLQYDVGALVGGFEELQTAFSDIYIKKSWMDRLLFIELSFTQIESGFVEDDQIPAMLDRIGQIFFSSKEKGAACAESIPVETPATSPTPALEAKRGLGVFQKHISSVKAKVEKVAEATKEVVLNGVDLATSVVEGELDFTLGYINILDRIIKSDTPSSTSIHTMIQMWGLEQLKKVLLSDHDREASFIRRRLTSETGIRIYILSRLKEYVALPEPLNNLAKNCLHAISEFIEIEERKRQEYTEKLLGINFPLRRYNNRDSFEEELNDCEFGTNPSTSFLAFVRSHRMWVFVDTPHSRLIHFAPSPYPVKEKSPKLASIQYESEALFTAPPPRSAPKCYQLYDQFTSGVFYVPVFHLITTNAEPVKKELSLASGEMLQKAKKELFKVFKASLDDQIVDLCKKAQDLYVNEISLQYYVEPNVKLTESQPQSVPITFPFFQVFIQKPRPSDVTPRETMDLSELRPRTLVLVGEGGMGKTAFGKYLEKQLWDHYEEMQIVPILISLPTIHDPKKRLIEKYLVEQGFSSENIQELKVSGRRLLFILDGYDEINLEFGINICSTNSLEEWNAQVLILSRSENIKDHYEQFGITRGPQEVLKWYLDYFDDRQTQELVEKYKKFGGAQGVTSASLFAQNSEFLQDLKELLKVPFILSMLLEIFPSLNHSDDNSRTKYCHEAEEFLYTTKLTKLNLFDKFTDLWFQRQKAKITPEKLAACHAETATSELRFNFLIGGDIVEDYKTFCEDVAIYMFKCGATALHYTPVWKEVDEESAIEEGRNVEAFDFRYKSGVAIVDTKNPLEKFFSCVNKSVQLVRSGCPIILEGRSTYMFLHKSLLDYFVARKIQKETRSCAEKPYTNFWNVRIHETLLETIQLRTNQLIQQVVQEVAEESPTLDDEIRSLFTKACGSTPDKTSMEKSILNSIAEGKNPMEACAEAVSKELPHINSSRLVENIRNRSSLSLGVTILLRSRIRKFLRTREQSRNTKYFPPLPQQALNLKCLEREIDVTKFLVEALLLDDLSSKPSFRDILLMIVEKSKWLSGCNCIADNNATKISMAAANSMTILVRANHNFSGADLRNVHLKGADLSGGVFQSTNFASSDISECNMQLTWLCNSCFSRSRMNGIYFAERPHVRMENIDIFAISPDGKYIGAATAGGMFGPATVSLILREDGSQQELCTGPEIALCFFTRNSTFFITRNKWSSVQVFDVKTRKTMWTRDKASSVSASPNSRLCAVTEGKTISLLTLSQGEVVSTLVDTSDVTCSFFFPYENYLASCSASHIAKIWDLTSYSELCNFECPESAVLCTVSSDSKLLAILHPNSLSLFDVSQIKRCHKIYHKTSEVFTKARQIQFSPDNSYVCTSQVQKAEMFFGSAAPACTVHITSSNSGETVRSIPGSYFCFTPEGTLSILKDFQLNFYDLSTSRLMFTPSNGPASPLANIEITPSAKYLFGRANNTIYLWSLHDGRLIHRFISQQDISSFSIFSSLLATISESKIFIWDIKTGKVAVTYTASCPLSVCAFSPAGGVFATLGKNQITFWEFHGMSFTPHITVHGDLPLPLPAMQFSPNGRILAVYTLLGVGALQIFEVATGECLFSQTASSTECLCLWKSSQVPAPLKEELHFGPSLLGGKITAELPLLSNQVFLRESASGKELKALGPFPLNCSCVAAQNDTLVVFVEKNAWVYKVQLENSQVVVKLYSRVNGSYWPLEASNSVFDEVKGLNSSNNKLLMQRGAIMCSDKPPFAVVADSDITWKKVNITTWNFDVFQVAKTLAGTKSVGALAAVTFGVVREWGLQALPIDIPKLQAFASKLESSYCYPSAEDHKNPYHNELHAADVTQSLFYIVTSIMKSSKVFGDIFTPLELLSCLIAGIIHDYNHPGRNGAFLKATMHPIHCMYGDSCLERFSLKSSFELLMTNPAYYVLQSLPIGQQQYVHNLVTQIVLATDMSRHKEFLAAFKASGISQGSKEVTPAEKILIMQMFMKLADISNVIREYNTCIQWNGLVMQEFGQQAADETQLHLPVTVFVNPPNNFHGFATAIVQPLLEALLAVFPSLEELKQQIQSNLAHSI
ncbi:NB-ARC domain protein [Pelomyxa schiedti]|nr:NB-ARC domain protein [Pelomyxa schiedti]